MRMLLYWRKLGKKVHWSGQNQESIFFEDFNETLSGGGEEEAKGTRK